MTITFSEAEKALKYIADAGLDAGTMAVRDMNTISAWQKLSVSGIHSLVDALGKTESREAREVLANEVKLRTLVYRHDYKAKMKRRRVLRTVQDLVSLFYMTKGLKSGIVSRRESPDDTLQVRQLTLHGPYTSYAELQDATGELHPGFVLRTPFNWYGEQVDLYGKYPKDWMFEALTHPGYELYGATEG